MLKLKRAKEEIIILPRFEAHVQFENFYGLVVKEVFQFNTQAELESFADGFVLKNREEIKEFFKYIAEYDCQYKRVDFYEFTIDNKQITLDINYNELNT